MAFPADKTRRDSIRSSSDGAISRGGGEGKIEKVVLVLDSGTL